MTNTKKKPFQVPPEMAILLEAEACRRRKKTGENINWSTILHEILANWAKKNR